MAHHGDPPRRSEAHATPATPAHPTAGREAGAAFSVLDTVGRHGLKDLLRNVVRDAFGGARDLGVTASRHDGGTSPP